MLSKLFRGFLLALYITYMYFLSAIILFETSGTNFAIASIKPALSGLLNQSLAYTNIASLPDLIGGRPPTRKSAKFEVCSGLGLRA